MLGMSWCNMTPDTQLCRGLQSASSYRYALTTSILTVILPQDPVDGVPSSKLRWSCAYNGN